MKYIDADLLRKEIEFAKSVYSNPKRVVRGVADAFRQDGRAAMCDDILKKLDTIPEQPKLKPMNIPSAGGGMSTTPPSYKLDVKPEVDLEKEEYVGVAESPLKTFQRVNEFEEGASYRH